MKTTKAKAKQYVFIYTDPDFPMDEKNIFFTKQTYKSEKDFQKNSGMEGCKTLMFLDDSGKDEKYTIVQDKKTKALYRLMGFGAGDTQIHLQNSELLLMKLTVKKGTSAKAAFHKHYDFIGVAK